MFFRKRWSDVLGFRIQTWISWWGLKIHEKSRADGGNLDIKEGYGGQKRSINIALTLGIMKIEVFDCKVQSLNQRMQIRMYWHSKNNGLIIYLDTLDPPTRSFQFHKQVPNWNGCRRLSLGTWASSGTSAEAGHNRPRNTETTLYKEIRTPDKQAFVQGKIDSIELMVFEIVGLLTDANVLTSAGLRPLYQCVNPTTLPMCWLRRDFDSGIGPPLLYQEFFTHLRVRVRTQGTSCCAGKLWNACTQLKSKSSCQSHLGRWAAG